MEGTQGFFLIGRLPGLCGSTLMQCGRGGPRDWPQATPEMGLVEEPARVNWVERCGARSCGGGVSEGGTSAGLGVGVGENQEWIECDELCVRLLLEARCEVEVHLRCDVM